MGLAYYNENDSAAAAWLRELIKQNLIAPGIVDERSIEDIKPDELRPFIQCHFFAGIGVWSYALRQAGWPDDRPVWTGSCPCQPFSAAGKGGGFNDERHLWPAWEYLIAQRRPEIIYGEQVASKDGLAWLDTVQTDLEGSGYAVGANDLCAAGVGAPHIRQRLFFVAEGVGNTIDAGLERHGRDGDTSQQSGRVSQDKNRPVAEGGGAGGLADTLHGRQQNGAAITREGGRVVQQPSARGESTDDSGASRVADTEHDDRRTNQPRGSEEGGTPDFWDSEGDDRLPCPTSGYWSNPDWLGCRDGKFRPVEPGTFPLVNGAPARVGRLRGYGNAINAEVAKTFILSYLDAERVSDI